MGGHPSKCSKRKGSLSSAKSDKKDNAQNNNQANGSALNNNVPNNNASNNNQANVPNNNIDNNNNNNNNQPAPPLISLGKPLPSAPPPPPFVVHPPFADPKEGSHPAPLRVTLWTDTIGASICFTTDGKTPTANSPAYLEPIWLVEPGRVLIKTFAFCGSLDSIIVTYEYNILLPARRPQELQRHVPPQQPPQPVRFQQPVQQYQQQYQQPIQQYQQPIQQQPVQIVLFPQPDSQQQQPRPPYQPTPPLRHGLGKRWCWEKGDGTWAPYSDDENTIIMLAQRQGLNQCVLERAGMKFKIYIDYLTEENTATKFRRAIKFE